MLNHPQKDPPADEPAPPVRAHTYAFSLIAAVLVLALAAKVALPRSTATLNFLIVVASLLHLALLFHGVRTLGRRTEVGWLVFVFGIFFWFLYAALERVLRGEPMAAKAVAIDAFPRHFSSALVGILVLSLAFQLGYMANLGSRFRRAAHRALGAREATVKRALLIALAIVAIHLIGFIALSGGPRGFVKVLLAGRTSTPIWENVAQAGTSFTPLYVLLTGLGVASGIFAGALAVSGRLRGWPQLAAFFAWMVPIVWSALAAGTRATVLMTIAPPILLAARERLRSGGGLKPRTLVITAGVLIALTIASNAIREFRSSASFEGEIELTVKDNDFFELAAFSFAIADREQELLYDSAFLQIVALPIPRVLWRDKPASKVVPLFTKYLWGPSAFLKGKSNLPSIVGQYFLGWGWYGIAFIGVCLGVMLRACDELIRHVPQFHVRLAALIFTIYLFISFRVIGNSGASVLYMTALILFLLKSRFQSPEARRR